MERTELWKVENWRYPVSAYLSTHGVPLEKRYNFEENKVVECFARDPKNENYYVSGKTFCKEFERLRAEDPMVICICAYSDQALKLYRFLVDRGFKNYNVSDLTKDEYPKAVTIANGWIHVIPYDPNTAKYTRNFKYLTYEQFKQLFILTFSEEEVPVEVSIETASIFTVGQRVFDTDSKREGVVVEFKQYSSGDLHPLAVEFGCYDNLKETICYYTPDGRYNAASKIVLFPVKEPIEVEVQPSNVREQTEEEKALAAQAIAITVFEKFVRGLYRDCVWGFTKFPSGSGFCIKIYKIFMGIIKHSDDEFTNGCITEHATLTLCDGQFTFQTSMEVTKLNLDVASLLKNWEYMPYQMTGRIS